MKRFTYLVVLLAMAFCLPAALHAQKGLDKVAKGIVEAGEKSASKISKGSENILRNAEKKAQQEMRLNTHMEVVSTQTPQAMATSKQALPSSTNLGKGTEVKMPKQIPAPGLKTVIDKKVAQAKEYWRNRSEAKENAEIAKAVEEVRQMQLEEIKSVAAQNSISTVSSDKIGQVMAELRRLSAAGVMVGHNMGKYQFGDDLLPHFRVQRIELTVPIDFVGDNGVAYKLEPGDTLLASPDIMIGIKKEDASSFFEENKAWHRLP